MRATSPLIWSAAVRLAQAILPQSRLSPRSPADPSAGPSLYGESFCASCHAVQNAAGNLVGGDVGPELTRIGNKAKPEWLRGMARQIPAHTIRQHPCRITASRRNRSRFWPAYLQSKSDSDYGAGVHPAPATHSRLHTGESSLSSWDARPAMKSTAFRSRRTSRRNSARIGSKPLAQIVFLPGMEHTVAELHRRQDSAAASLRRKRQNAAVHADHPRRQMR